MADLSKIETVADVECFGDGRLLEIEKDEDGSEWIKVVTDEDHEAEPLLLINADELYLALRIHYGDAP